MRYFQLLTTPLFAISLSLVCNGEVEYVAEVSVVRGHNG